MMTRRILICAVMVFVVFLPTACSMSSQKQGPLAWIDQPLDGMHFPVGTIILQAHASDANGVSAIKFYVGESLLQTVSASGGRLGEARIEWMPPGPGTYLIGASGVDNQGNNGSKAVAQISVGEVQITVTPAPVIEQGPDVTMTPTFTPAITITPSPTVAPAPSGPSFTALKNANCREGPGTAYDADETLFQGETVLIQGRNTDSSWLWVSKSSSRNCWVSVTTGQITGDINTVQYASAPPPPQPAAPDSSAGNSTSENSGNTVEAQPTYLLLDLNPPAISGVSIKPPSIQSDGCGQPSTATIRAVVTDDVGVTYVAARVSNGAEVPMSAAGGGTYRATLGPYAAGNLSIVVVASDGAGHSTQSGAVTLLVVCIQ